MAGNWRILPVSVLKKIQEKPTDNPIEKSPKFGLSEYEDNSVTHELWLNTRRNTFWVVLLYQLQKGRHKRDFCEIDMGFIGINGAKYSRMDQIKLVEDSLWKIWSDVVFYVKFLAFNTVVELSHESSSEKISK